MDYTLNLTFNSVILRERPLLDKSVIDLMGKGILFSFCTSEVSGVHTVQSCTSGLHKSLVPGQQSFVRWHLLVMFSVYKVHHITLLASRILRGLLDVRKVVHRCCM
jgi:hypothetical protein